MQTFKGIYGPVGGFDDNKLADGLTIGEMRWQKAVHEVCLHTSDGYGTLVLIEKMPKINQEMRLF